MKVLKEKTQSLCPVCAATLPARVLARDRSVFLEYQCPQHGARQAMIERDPDFYAAVMTRQHKPPNPPPYLTVFPTYRCNINCNVCYVPRRDPAMDMSLEYLADLLDRWPHKDVWFAGGEPTVMENLPEIMALTRAKRKRPYIVTNGIRMADPQYVATLVRHGLYGVSLSLNALNGEILEAVDGRNHLEAKLRAISHLKRHLRRFAVCFTLVRGVNESEFATVLRFALRQYPFVRSFHAECLPGIGREINHQPFFLSELLDMFGGAIGSNRGWLMKMAAQGKAMLGLYGFQADFRDLMTDGVYLGGGLSSSVLRFTRAIGSVRPHIRIRLITGPLPETVDLEETWSARSTMAISKESPLMELWEYFVRYQRKTL